MQRFTTTGSAQPQSPSQHERVYPTRCPHCAHPLPADGLRPIGAQLLRAARWVARIALQREQSARAAGVPLTDPDSAPPGVPWVTASDLCRALPDLHSESAAGMQLRRASAAGLLQRQRIGTGIRYGYRPTPLLVAYELPDTTEEGGND